MNNFNLAPPAKIVDGLNAVPMEISRISASIIFDASTQVASVDVTVDFEVGSAGGNPFFDLRQNISEAWLDGNPITPAQLTFHDFGGGIDAELRIVEQILPADSSHTLRLRYTLGTPLAPLPSDRYLPQLTWSAGPRLVFNFGFSDLSPGRYLETWIPSNLIFDQFRLELDIQITNTTIAHSLITNGEISPSGTNHWSVSFPEYFTAFSHMLELRATDTLDSLTDIVLLPISGKTVSVEIWKLTSSSITLTSIMTYVKNFLIANENDYGAYIHNDRYVAFMISGGMEYDGGTTTGTGALQHEVFHSWYGRGVKPASQRDSWWDEAWTVYNMYGANSSIPFNFSDSPIQLCSQNPYSRVTAINSYSDGKRVFDGLASLIGISNLINIMTELYNNHSNQPVTTQELEALLLCRSGNQSIVDAFHLFVYGFANPTDAPDLWIKDDPAHTGSDFWAGRFWDSPDLWVRHQDDGGTTHQAPEYGQDNWLYARVHNRSTTATAAHFMVAFNIKTFAGTEFLYPNDFLPCVAAASGFNLDPGETTIVKAKWAASLVPPAGTHSCLLASVHTRSEHPVPGTHVWEHNNLAQKNLTIVDLNPGDWIIVPFVLYNIEEQAYRRSWLEIIQYSKSNIASFSLMHPDGVVISGQHIEKIERPKKKSSDVNKELIECGSEHLPVEEEYQQNLGYWTSNNLNLTSKQFNNHIIQKFDVKLTTKVAFKLNIKNGYNLMGIKVEVPKNASPGEILTIDIIKRTKPFGCLRRKKTTGGIALQIRVGE